MHRHVEGTALEREREHAANRGQQREREDERAKATSTMTAPVGRRGPTDESAAPI